MAAQLPYLTNPASLALALEGLKLAATPPNVNADFVQTKLQIKGGGGRAIPPYLKKVGFVASDGTATTIYTRFRNSNKKTSGGAAADALKFGYKALYEVNEYAHDLNNEDLKGLVVQVTGLEEDSRVVDFVLKTFKKLKSYADFDVAPGDTADKTQGEDKDAKKIIERTHRDHHFNIAYTINLNLPPSTNVEVFNAIFKSLKENLLSDD